MQSPAEDRMISRGGTVDFSSSSSVLAKRRKVSSAAMRPRPPASNNETEVKVGLVTRDQCQPYRPYGDIFGT